MRPRRAIQILSFLAVSSSGYAEAATSGAIYDMRRFLNETHPFEQTYTPAAAPTPQRPAPLPAAPQPALQPLPQATAPPPRPTPSVAQATSRPAAAVPAAQPARGAAQGHFISELRGGLLAHDVGPFSHQKEDGVDVNAEILFTSPKFMELIWSPRPTIGATINTSGDTSQGYMGLTWEWDFWEQAYFSFFWGGAAHNGEKTANLPDKKDLGCSVLFREGLDLGWRFAENQAVMVHFSHISNAKICDSNEGLETIGVRYGYRF